MVLVMAGLTIGVGGSLLLTRVLGGLLFEIEPTDPGTLVAVSILLLVVAAAACLVPARRATLVQPIVALRS
jgi:ABC-type antimicrobial peptide transport system permease subunit